jgi:hypothetical protein
VFKIYSLAFNSPIDSPSLLFFHPLLILIFFLAGNISSLETVNLL